MSSVPFHLYRVLESKIIMTGVLNNKFRTVFVRQNYISNFIPDIEFGQVYCIGIIK